MNNFIISVDSSASLTKDELQKHGILMACLTYSLDGHEYIDKFENDTQKQELYDKLASGHMAQSSKVNPDSYKNAWADTLEQGKDIIHLSLSSNVSGSYESACIVAKEMSEQYGRKIYVVDTKTGSYAITAMAFDLMKIQKTATIEEARDFALESINEYNLIFTVGDIKYLYRGGRISHMKAIIGGLLHLKPILFVNEQGKLTFVMNARGTKQALAIIVKKMIHSATEETNCAYISHGGDIALAESLKSKINELFPRIKDFRIDYLTPVLGLHAGPGSLVLCFKGAQRQCVLEEAPSKEMSFRNALAKA